MDNMEQDPVGYPLVSILYCIKCNWVLRAAWYQQELLQTLTAKAATADEALIKAVILKPSYTPGTFKVCVKKSHTDPWVVVWDRTENGGFPEAKYLKQVVRNVVSPDTKLGHSDKQSKSKGTLVAQPEFQFQQQEGSSAVNGGDGNNVVPEAKAATHGAAMTAAPSDRTVHHPTKSDLEIYGCDKLAENHKTFCEECLENLPPTWEM